MKKATQDLLLGTVFFASIGVLIWATFTLQDIALLARPQVVRVRFDSAEGLRKGDPVFVLGMRNGQVSALDIVPAGSGYEVQAELQFERRIPLKRDARARIVDANLLGGKQVSVEPGTAAEALPDTAILRGESPPGLGKSLGEADISGTVTSIKNVFDRLLDPRSNVGALLNERTLYDDLAASIRSLRVSMEEIQRGEGILGRLVHDEALGGAFADSMTNLRDITDKVNRGPGPIARLLNDEQMGNALSEIVLDVRTLIADVRAGRGTLGALFRDEAMAADLRELAASARSIAAKVDDPDAGLLGALTGDTQMLARFDMFIADIADFACKMNRGDGLLPKLVNDPALGEKLERVLNQVARAIEDAREAAPVSTFFQVLSGPF